MTQTRTGGGIRLSSRIGNRNGQALVDDLYLFVKVLVIRMSGFFARLKKREKHQPEPLKVTSTVDSTTLDEAATPSKVDPPSQPPPVSHIDSLLAWP